jgi:hypothetical protein
MPCVVCTVHRETRSTCFLVWPRNQGRWFVSGLASKPLGRVSLFGLKTKIDSLLVVWPQNHWVMFLDLGLKTDSSGLMIWASKSLRWFLGLSFETKQASVCPLFHKTDGGRSACDSHRDLVACFTWKQVGLWCPSLASRFAEA